MRLQVQKSIKTISRYMVRGKVFEDNIEDPEAIQGYKAIKKRISNIKKFPGNDSYRTINRATDEDFAEKLLFIGGVESCVIAIGYQHQGDTEVVLPEDYDMELLNDALTMLTDAITAWETNEPIL